MAKFQYMSDLHLEFPGARKFFRKKKIKPIGDVLLLAGDIGYIHQYTNNSEFKDFWNYCSDNWKHTCVIPGNHEFYTNGDIPRQIMDELPNYTEIRNNIYLLNNAIKVIDENIDIIGSTLWSDIPEDKKDIIQYSMNDYRLIWKKENVTLTPDMSIEMFHQNTDFIKKALALNPDHKKIVMTHHAPLLDLAKQGRHVNSPIANAYATDCNEILDYYNFDYWIYGHTHTNANVELPGNKKIVSNGCGYVVYQEQVANGFEFDSCFEL